MTKEDDPRFKDMHSAPIFKKSHKEKFKTKVDDRFKSVLSDDRFHVSSSASVDCYGRKKSAKASAAKELKEFYDIEEEEPSTTDSKSKRSGGGIESRLDYLNKLARGEVSCSSSDDDDEEEDSEVSEAEENHSDEDDESSDEDEVEVDGVDNPLAIPGDEVEYAEDEETGALESSRLAIQNCDWDNVTAEDILMILQSFCPTGGVVKSVTVYPSDFGLQQMEYEEIHGPPKEIFKHTSVEEHNSTGPLSNDDGDDEGSEIEASTGNNSEEDDDEKNSDDEEEDTDDEEDDMRIMSIDDMPSQEEGAGDFVRPERKAGLVYQLDDDGEEKTSRKSKDTGVDVVALRAYELSKLRYYFAIAELDSPSTADKLYRELDGMELEHSSMAMDLRVVPDEVSFEDRKVRDKCVKPSATYVPPNDFVLNAMQRTSVQCSWENDDARDGGGIMARRRAHTATASKWRDLQESDMLQYMASDASSEEDSDVESDDDDDSDSDENDRTSSKKRSKKASKLRKLLLGDDGEEGSDSEGSRDEFFMSEDESNAGDHDEGFVDDRDDEGGEVDKVMTFVPSDNEDENRDNETPAEAKKRARAQKKANKKASAVATDTNDVTSRNGGKKKGERKSKVIEEDPVPDSVSADQLELMFAGDGDEVETADRLKFSKKEFEKTLKAQSKKQKKRKRSNEENKDADNFELDLSDDRFKAVIEGSNPDFGIDPTANEFRPTEGMKKVLDEQHKHREKRQATKSISRHQTSYEESNVEAVPSSQAVKSLADKLKTKLSRESNKKSKKSRTS